MEPKESAWLKAFDGPSKLLEAVVKEVIKRGGNDEDLQNAVEDPVTLSAIADVILRHRVGVLPSEMSLQLGEGEIKLGDSIIHLTTGVIRGSGKLRRLTKLELAVLRCLFTHRVRCVTASELRQSVWGERANNEAVVMTINRLRRKLRSDGRYLVTVYGEGYQLVHVALPDV